jgi:integral membrane protein
VRLFWTYRVLALVVGVLLVVGTANATLKYGHFLNIPGLEAGGTLHQFGHDTDWVWLPHGWVYIIYLIVAFILTQKANWSLPRFGVMLIAGLVPVMIFFVEHRVVQRLRAEHPELTGGTVSEDA